MVRIHLYHVILLMLMFLTLFLPPMEWQQAVLIFMQIVFPLIFMGFKGTPNGEKDKLAVLSLKEDRK